MSDSGYGHEDIPCMTYDIHVDIFTWMCMGLFDHCMSTYVGSNSCRRLLLLGFVHPVVEPPFQLQVMRKRLTRIRDRRYEESRMWLWTIFCIFILEQSILIYHFV